LSELLVDVERAIIAHNQSAEVPEPSDSAFDNPALLVAPQHAPALVRCPVTVGAMRGNQGNTTSSQPFARALVGESTRASGRRIRGAGIPQGVYNHRRIGTKLEICDRDLIGTMTSPFFGRASGANPAREVQVSLEFYFLRSPCSGGAGGKCGNSSLAKVGSRPSGAYPRETTYPRRPDLFPVANLRKRPGPGGVSGSFRGRHGERLANMNQGSTGCSARRGSAARPGNWWAHP